MDSPDCTPMLKALADETRWRLVQHLLSSGRANVNALTEMVKASQPSVSKHLRILREAGIVASEKEGTVVWYAVSPAFRQQVEGKGRVLDLGCCTFQF